MNCAERRGDAKHVKYDALCRDFRRVRLTLLFMFWATRIEGNMPDGSAIVVIGGSAGSFNPIRSILADFPADFPASIFVVVHTSPAAPGYLANIFGKACKLPVQYAEDFSPIELSKVYLAPADRHLLVKTGEVRVIRGPRENHHRPAVDALFRTAARTYGSQVIGVIISGALEDGSVGCVHIKDRGGIVIVQAPEDAAHPDMPLSAISRIKADYVVKADEIASTLIRLVDDGVADDERDVPPQLDVAEGRISALSLPGLQKPSSPFICPDCGGAFWEQVHGDRVPYRCHTGHGFTGETLLTLQSAELEQVLKKKQNCSSDLRHTPTSRYTSDFMIRRTNFVKAAT
jgi:two-component system, chemotaxis family, protein-glutamate methylesterase/glutaminase